MRVPEAAQAPVPSSKHKLLRCLQLETYLFTRVSTETMSGLPGETMADWHKFGLTWFTWRMGQWPELTCMCPSGCCTARP